jgi:GNAT superfamily N-acetyltransferase
MSERPVGQGAAYQLVPFTEAHVAPFTAWCSAPENTDVWTEASVRRRTIEDPAYDPSLMLCIQGQGPPIGYLIGSITDGRGWVRALLVRPGRRRGIGTLMFEAIERALLERGITKVHAGWDSFNSFLPGMDIKYTPAIAFLDQRDYQTSREAREYGRDHCRQRLGH